MARWKYVEVEVDLQDFDSADLAEELESRGYVVVNKVEVDLQDFDSADLAEELESRGYVVVNTPETLPLDKDLMLRQMYETKKLGGNIDQQLADYFWQKLNVIL